MCSSDLGIEFGFGFLSKEASFDIQFSLIDYDGSMSYGRAYLVGLLNTLLVSFIGIILCTLLGAVVGVARLSPNYLIRKTASFYIEFFRNVPLLLQIFFWYFAALRALPMPEDAPLIFGSSFMTIKGLYTPAPIWNNLDVFMIALIIAMIVIYFFNKFAKRKQEEEGKQYPKFLISLGIFILLPALTLALTLYTATFIAENVRAGIQGIGKGQKEAAASIGLTPGQVLKLVVLPQALRIIIPPTTNQYLNLTKNSSLAAAIAYPDLVLVFAGTAMMQTGRAIEIVGITMATYLTISLYISLFMNWYNKRIAIQEK